MTLINQPTSMPSRKIGAVIIATFLVQGGVGVAEYFLPGIEGMLPASEWIAALIPLMAGYMTRERAQ